MSEERNWIEQALDEVPQELKKWITVGPEGTSITIKMQHDPVSKVGVCGIQVGELIWLPRCLIHFLNKKFPCRENSLTITKLEEAQHWDQARTSEREKRGVEGHNLP